MEEDSSSASPPPSDLNPTASGTASKFLSNLPSRGLFSSTVSSSNLGGMRIYVCDHNTTPPENQVIKTDQMNILIRSLTLKKQRSELPDGSRKRASDRTADGRAPAKRTITSSQNNGRQSKPMMIPGYLHVPELLSFSSAFLISHSLTPRLRFQGIPVDPRSFRCISNEYPNSHKLWICASPYASLLRVP